MLNQNLLHFSLAVTVSRICYLLNGLSGNKATGIDKISCKIIKIAVPAISDSLTLIFNQAITLSSFRVRSVWAFTRFFETYYWSIGKFYHSEIYKLILKL